MPVCRFLPIVFEELPKAEWQAIVAAKLGKSAEAHVVEPWAKRMVDFHTAFSSVMSGGSQLFPEVTAYSGISIRELLKWVGHEVSSQQQILCDVSACCMCRVFWCDHVMQHYRKECIAA